MCRSASADGLAGRLRRCPREPIIAAFGPMRTTSFAAMAPFETALAVMARVNGFRDTSVLKLPLVPSVHPRA